MGDTSFDPPRDIIDTLRCYVAAIVCPDSDLKVGLAMCANAMSEAADEIERQRKPRFHEPGYVSPPQPLHTYRPHRKWPWFCGECGYPEHERLKHRPRDTDRSPQGGNAKQGSTRSAEAEGIAQKDPS